jgi:hypothetical protein
MRLGLCSRSKDVIEPVLKPQWWVDCKDAAARSCAAVRDGSLQIIPAEFEAVWFRWGHWGLLPAACCCVVQVGVLGPAACCLLLCAQSARLVAGGWCRYLASCL